MYCLMSVCCIEKAFVHRYFFYSSYFPKHNYSENQTLIFVSSLVLANDWQGGVFPILMLIILDAKILAPKLVIALQAGQWSASLQLLIQSTHTALEMFGQNHLFLHSKVCIKKAPAKKRGRVRWCNYIRQ